MTSKNIFFYVIIVLTICGGSAAAQNWPMVNLNKERTSWAADETMLYPPLQMTSKYRLKSAGTTHAFTLFNNVLAVSMSATPNTLEMIDITSSDTLWTFKVPESKSGMNFYCAQTGSMVIAGGQHGAGLYALNKTTGAQIWSKPVGNCYGRHVIIDDDCAFVQTDSLYCLSLDDGSTLWAQNIHFQGTPAVDELYVYTVGRYKTSIWDKASGERVWQIPNSERVMGGIAVDDQCFYTFSHDTVFAYYKQDRSIKWTYISSGDTLLVSGHNTFAVSDSHLCFIIEGNGIGQSELVTLNKNDGEYLWSHAFTGQWLYTPTIANGMVYIVSLFGELFGFNIETGTLEFSDDYYAYYGQPIVVNHKLYVGTDYRIIVFENAETKVEHSKSVPHRPKLMQNFPNPFNPVTTIKYTLSHQEHVKLAVYDIRGNEIKTLVDETIPAGMHCLEFNASHLPSGVYVYRLAAGSFAKNRKLVLVR